MFNNFRKFAKTLKGEHFWFDLSLALLSIAEMAACAWVIPNINSHFGLACVLITLGFLAFSYIMAYVGKFLPDYIHDYKEYLRNQETLEKTAENVDKNQVKSDVKQIVKEHQSDMEKIIHQVMQKPPKTGDKPILQDNLRKELDDVLEQVVSGKMGKKETMKKVAEIMKKHKQQNSDIKKQIDALNSGHEM